MKNFRPRIKYSQTPHSISRWIETLSNKTAAALLSLINRKTVGFGQGFVDLPYSLIAKELRVTSRTITSAAKLLEQCGAIVRERVSHRIYRWRIVLSRDEILEDPRGIFLVKNQASEPAPEARSGPQVLIDRSGPCGSIDQDHADRSIRTMGPRFEQCKPIETRVEGASFEQKAGALKNSFKETHVKKHHAEPARRPSSKDQLTLDLPSAKSDDEPLYKHCLRALVKYGLSQRMARKLCREHSHELIRQVLEHVPQLSGVDNLPGYLVAAIRDGGYSFRGQVDESSLPAGQKNGHQVSGGRSNYAHLTASTVSSQRYSIVKPEQVAPMTYRSVGETQAELKAAEAHKSQREEEYKTKSRQLAKRFAGLSEDLKLQIKLVASVHLSKLVPASGKREEMLRDKTFQRVANRTVLERFFEWVDQGLDEWQALERLECRAAA